VLTRLDRADFSGSPVVEDGAVVGALLLAERVDLTIVVGFLAILAGFLLVKREAIRAAVAQLRRPQSRR